MNLMYKLISFQFAREPTRFIVTSFSYFNPNLPEHTLKELKGNQTI
jgi:hypothetical protein